MLIREEHQVIGKCEDAFEEALRDEWMPGIAAVLRRASVVLLVAVLLRSEQGIHELLHVHLANIIQGRDVDYY